MSNLPFRAGPSGPLIGVSNLIGYMRLANITLGVAVPTLATPDQMLAFTALITDFSLVSDGRFSKAANAVLTYTGPDIQVLAKQTCCTFISGVVCNMYGATALNGDLIGEDASEIGAPLVEAGAGMGTTVNADFASQLVSSRLLTLTDGDTIQPVVGYAPTVGSANTGITFYELELWQTSNLAA